MSLLNREQLLLHHFASKISFTLSDRIDFQTVWSLHIPRDSYDYPHLMHGILAVSALHLARTAKSFDTGFYTDLAIHHHNLALSFLRPVVTSVTARNFDALYASAMLTFLFNIGLLKFSDSSRLVRDITALSELAKGILAVRREGTDRHKIGNSHLVREYRSWDSPLPLPMAINRTIKNIEHVVHSLPETGEEAENKNLYIQTTKRLRLTLNALTRNPDHPAMIYMWFSLVDRRYIELLKYNDPLALLILAHYGICMLLVKDTWWASTCARYIITAVRDILDTSEAIRLLEGVMGPAYERAVIFDSAVVIHTDACDGADANGSRLN